MNQSKNLNARKGGVHRIIAIIMAVCLASQNVCLAERISVCLSPRSWFGAAQKDGAGYICSKTGKAVKELNIIRRRQRWKLKNVKLNNFAAIVEYIGDRISFCEPGRNLDIVKEGLERLKRIYEDNRLLSFEKIIHGQEDYALGYGSENEIGIAEELLELPMPLLAELVFHEAICFKVEHEQARTTQRVLFPENHDELKTELRKVIDIFCLTAGRAGKPARAARKIKDEAIICAKKRDIPGLKWALAKLKMVHGLGPKTEKQIEKEIMEEVKKAFKGSLSKRVGDAFKFYEKNRDKEIELIAMIEGILMDEDERRNPLALEGIAVLLYTIARDLIEKEGRLSSETRLCLMEIQGLGRLVTELVSAINYEGIDSISLEMALHFAGLCISDIADRLYLDRYCVEPNTPSAFGVHPFRKGEYIPSRPDKLGRDTPLRKGNVDSAQRFCVRGKGLEATLSFLRKNEKVIAVEVRFNNGVLATITPAQITVRKNGRRMRKESRKKYLDFIMDIPEVACLRGWRSIDKKRHILTELKDCPTRIKLPPDIIPPVGQIIAEKVTRAVNMIISAEKDIPDELQGLYKRVREALTDKMKAIMVITGPWDFKDSIEGHVLININSTAEAMEMTEDFIVTALLYGAVFPERYHLWRYRDDNPFPALVYGREDIATGKAGAIDKLQKLKRRIMKKGRVIVEPADFILFDTVKKERADAKYPYVEYLLNEITANIEYPDKWKEGDVYKSLQNIFRVMFIQILKCPHPGLLEIKDLLTNVNRFFVGPPDKENEPKVRYDTDKRNLEFVLPYIPRDWEYDFKKDPAFIYPFLLEFFIAGLVKPGTDCVELVQAIIKTPVYPEYALTCNDIDAMIKAEIIYWKTLITQSGKKYNSLISIVRQLEDMEFYLRAEELLDIRVALEREKEKCDSLSKKVKREGDWNSVYDLLNRLRKMLFDSAKLINREHLNSLTKKERELDILLDMAETEQDETLSAWIYVATARMAVVLQDEVTKLCRNALAGMEIKEQKGLSRDLRLLGYTDLVRKIYPDIYFGRPEKKRRTRTVIKEFRDLLCSENNADKTADWEGAMYCGVIYRPARETPVSHFMREGEESL